MSIKDSLNELKEIDFADLDIQQIGVWPNSVKTLLLVLVLIFPLAAGYFFKIKELREQDISAARQEIKLLEQYQNKAFQAANLDAYRQQIHCSRK